MHKQKMEQSQRGHLWLEESSVNEGETSTLKEGRQKANILSSIQKQKNMEVRKQSIVPHRGTGKVCIYSRAGTTALPFIYRAYRLWEIKIEGGNPA